MIERRRFIVDFALNQTSFCFFWGERLVFMQKLRYLLHFGTNPGLMPAYFRRNFLVDFVNLILCCLLLQWSFVENRQSSLGLGNWGQWQQQQSLVFSYCDLVKNTLCRKHHRFTNALMDQKEHPTNSKSNNPSKIQWDLTNGPYLRKLQLSY